VADHDADWASILAIAIVSNIFTIPLAILMERVFTKMLLPPAYGWEFPHLTTLLSPSTSSLGLEWFTRQQNEDNDGDKGGDEGVNDSGKNSPKQLMALSEAYKHALEELRNPKGISQVWQSLRLWCHHRLAGWQVRVAPTETITATTQSVYDDLDTRRRKIVEHYLKGMEEKKKFDEAVDCETAKMCEGARRQWSELSEAIQELENIQVVLKEASIAKEDAKGNIVVGKGTNHTRLEVLRCFKREFERRWHLDPKGEPAPNTLWEQLTGRNFYKRLRKKISADLRMADKIEKELQDLQGVQRELRLMELYRCKY